MRGCMGVVVGLIIGAVLSFSVLAVVALVEGTTQSTCEVNEPTGWLIRAQVPWEEITREVASTTFAVGGGTLRIREVKPGECGYIVVWAEWAGQVLFLPGIGLELEAGAGVGELRPVRLHLGRLSLPLGWLPEPWLDRARLPLAQMGGAVLTRELQGEGVSLCGLTAEPAGLAVYLCEAGD